MKPYLAVILLFTLPLLRVHAYEQDSGKTTTLPPKKSTISRFEIPNSQVIPILDSQTNRQYELYIKLPKRYSTTSNTHYPTIYFTDAAMHIELLSASTAFLMEDVILVGISWQRDIQQPLKSEGPHVSRFRDFTIKPSNDPKRQEKYNEGQAANHLSFIRNDVIKFVDHNFRTNPSQRTFFGYSLGGLFGAYILMAQPDTFKNYILGSPSVWQDVSLLSNIGSKHKTLNANIFISHGSREGDLSKHITELIHALRERKDNSLSITYKVIQGDHDTAFPSTGVSSIDWLSHIDQNVSKQD